MDCQTIFEKNKIILETYIGRLTPNSNTYIDELWIYNSKTNTHYDVEDQHLIDFVNNIVKIYNTYVKNNDSYTYRDSSILIEDLEMISHLYVSCRSYGDIDIIGEIIYEIEKVLNEDTNQTERFPHYQEDSEEIPF